LAPQVVDPATGNRIPIGGDGEALFSGELRVGTFRVWGNPLDFVAFVDAGDVTPSLMQLHFNDLHYAVGPDLLYQTPIGPMRAGLGIRLNRLGENSPNGLSNPDPGQRFAFHITLGEAF
jgi:outer membrane protein assembly factor BamA